MPTFMNDLDQTKDIAMTYSFLEDIFKYPYREKRIRARDSYLNNSRCFLTLISTMMSYLIGYSYEKIKKYDEKIIDNVLDSFSFWKSIKCKQELSIIEKFRQFRNCFEHANFLLCFDDSVEIDENGNYLIVDFNQIKYHFVNEKIEGEITFVEFLQLYPKCIDLFTKYNQDNKIAMFIFDGRIRRPGQVRNQKDLENILKSIITRDISASFNPLSSKVNISIDDRQFNDFAHYGSSKRNYEWNPNALYSDPTGSMLNTMRTRNYIKNKVALGMNQIDIVSRKLTDEEKDKIRRHVMFVTNNFTKPYAISDDFIHQVFSESDICFKAEDVILSIFHDFLIADFNTYSLYGLQKRIISDYGTRQFYDDLIALSPSLYLTTIISSANFFLNYSYEINKKMNGEVFRYSEIDINGIDIVNRTSDKLVKMTDPMLKENEKFSDVKKELEEMSKKLEWSKKQIEILNNPKNKDPNKAQKMIGIKDFIDNYDKRKKELETKAILLSSKISSSSSNLPYEDSYHLFRHLRNSISHGRFIVDFDDGYKHGDLGESTITFYDIDDGVDESLSNASVIIKMKLKRFEQLSKDLANTFCSQMKKEQFNEISRRIAYIQDAGVKNDVPKK